MPGSSAGWLFLPVGLASCAHDRCCCTGARGSGRPRRCWRRRHHHMREPSVVGGSGPRCPGPSQGVGHGRPVPSGPRRWGTTSIGAATGSANDDRLTNTVVNGVRMAELAMPAAVAQGTSDCEEIRDSLLSQPVLALSSLSFVLAGGWLLWVWRGLPARQRWPASVYAGLLVLVGIGSVDFHGPQSPAAQLLHDLPIALVVGQAVAVPLSRALRRRPILRPGSRGRVIATAVLGVLAAAAYSVGRSGSPLCDPESWVQPHDAWHVLSAAALAVWATALWPIDTGSISPETPVRAT